MGAFPRGGSGSVLTIDSPQFREFTCVDYMTPFALPAGCGRKEAKERQK